MSAWRSRDDEQGPKAAARGHTSPSKPCAWDLCQLWFAPRAQLLVQSSGCGTGTICSHCPWPHQCPGTSQERLHMHGRLKAPALAPRRGRRSCAMDPAAPANMVHAQGRAECSSMGSHSARVREPGAEPEPARSSDNLFPHVPGFGPRPTTSGTRSFSHLRYTWDAAMEDIKKDARDQS